MMRLLGGLDFGILFIEIQLKLRYLEILLGTAQYVLN
jgi:hypothetical protein